MMSGFFKKHLGPWLRLKENGSVDIVYWAAAVVYILLALGMVFFVAPQVENASLVKRFAYGFLYGVIIYGVYEATNYTLLKDWPLAVFAADVVWGGVSCGIVALLVFLI